MSLLMKHSPGRLILKRLVYDERLSPVGVSQQAS